VTELVLTDGPARYLGGSIETFALPYGAFIVVAAFLYVIFRRPHSVPGMRYLTPAHQTSTGTREPGASSTLYARGPIPAPAAAGAGAAAAPPGGQAPHEAADFQAADAGSRDQPAPGRQAEGEA
jgi:hypothetical protein